MTLQTPTTLGTTPIVMVLVILSVVLPVSFGAAPLTPTPDHVVYPTGQWATDVENIQAAVDLGGTVLLKATNVAGQPTAFNFGVLENTILGLGIFVRRDVWLLGESAESARTMIVGGYRPVAVGILGWNQPLAPIAPKFRIDGITFDGPYQAAIDIYKASRPEVVGNRISNVIVRGGIGVGINVFGGGAQRRITGRVAIADNVIQYPALLGSFIHGIVLDNVAADVDIEGNWVQNTQNFTGILVVRQVEGTVRISRNFVAPHPDAPGAGIGIYIYANDLWDGIRASSPVYKVVDNRVFSRGFGIGLVGQRGSIDAPLIERNQVSVSGFPWAEAFFAGGNVSNARVWNNRFDGSGAFGFDLFLFEPGQLAEANTFVGNNLTQFDADTEVFLDRHTLNTVVVGRSGTVIDLGIGNQITGFSRIDGQHVGPQIAERGWFDIESPMPFRD